MSSSDKQEEVVCRHPDCSRAFESNQGMSRHLGQMHDVSELILSDIQRIADSLGKKPTVGDVRADNESMCVRRINEEFGSWDEALEEAGFDPRGVTEDKLLDILRNLAEKLGRAPTNQDITEHADVSIQPFYNYFDGLLDALEQAGIEHNPNRVTDEDLLGDLQRLDDKFDPPVRKDLIQNEGRYSYGTYSRRFENMNVARNRADIQHDNYDKNDQRISDDELINAVHDFVDEFGRQPRADEMNEKGKYCRSSYVRRFGSWNEAIRRAGYEPIPPGDKVVGKEHPRWKEETNFCDYYGPNWHDQRQTVIERDGNTCRLCGYVPGVEDRGLDVHHIKPARMFEGDESNYKEMNDEKNLITLCRSCHSDVEGEMQECDHDEFEDKAEKLL